MLRGGLTVFGQEFRVCRYTGDSVLYLTKSIKQNVKCKKLTKFAMWTCRTILLICMDILFLPIFVIGNRRQKCSWMPCLIVGT